MAKELPAIKKAYLSMTAFQITEILRNQHTKDVFVSECKDGSSWGGHARMDVWTMNRSWSRLCFTGYEIKVSRNDFKQDNKWHSYLPLCNQLYFVCPKGMIDPSEMPDGVGLKYCTENRATTIRKAAHREVVPPMELFCYILMARTRVVDSTFHAPENEERRIEKFKKWLADKIENRRIGDILRYEISKTIDHIHTENDSLRGQVNQWKFIAQFTNEVGIHSWDNESKIRQKISDFKKIIPEKFIVQIKALIKQANGVIELVEESKDIPRDYEI